MSTLSTHVLDVVAGRPAAGIAVVLSIRGGDRLDEAVTDADGRVAALGAERLDAGDYELRFDLAGYYPGDSAFYPEIVIVFTVDDPDQHFHVPVLLSPYGFTTYRGS